MDAIYTGMIHGGEASVRLRRVELYLPGTGKRATVKYAYPSGLLVIVLSLSSALFAMPDRTVADTLSRPDFINGITATNRESRTGLVQISGSALTAPWKKIYIFSAYGRVYTKLDSTDVVNRQFSFSPREYITGVYMIGPSEGNMCPVIINPVEASLKLMINGAKMDGGTRSEGSAENDGWLSYYPQENSLLRQRRDALSALRKAADKTELEKKVAEKDEELFRLRRNLIQQYPDTYLAKLLTWKQEPYPNDREKYWDNIDFSDESLTRCPVLSDRIQNFMRTFSGGKDAGFISCIEHIANKAKANDHVLEFALNQMMTGFYESGMEHLSTYIIDNYVNGEACGEANLSAIIRNNAESISKLSIGNIPPNLVDQGIDGASVDLMEIASANRYTLVMFWSSWCEHCQGEAPEVKICHDTWKKKGFEIVGYSVDTQAQAWREAVNQRQFSFPNICGYKAWESKGARDYRVSKTPTFFLLDNQGKIVLKPKSIREVQTFLNNHL